jgi:hypothetical protein
VIVYVIYNKDTLAERLASDYLARLASVQVEAELMDADSPRGIQLCENYDILGRPALAVIREDGSPTQVWQGGDSLPVPTDVAYLVHQ